MKREFITPKSEEHWLQMRTKDVTSTEISALFGCHSYGLTEYGLYQRKTGLVVDEWNDNDRMRWGRRMEATIAYGIAEDLGLVVEPFKDYGRIPDIRMGSSFDFKVVGLAENYDGDDTYRDLFRDHGPGIVEVKNVDGFIFKKSWIDQEGLLEAPPQIEFQIQHQLVVSGLSWCLGAPLIGGNTPKPFYRLYDQAIAEALMEKIVSFWERVDKGDEPPLDYLADGDDIQKVFTYGKGEIDLTENPRVVELCEKYDRATDFFKAADIARQEARNELTTILYDVKGEDDQDGKTKAVADGFNISSWITKENPGKLITEEMVGERVGGRKPVRQTRITRHK